ncbi:hypothetical protein M2475_002139 [Breznakia sp. PF5-3]|uniref:hypothetical protein n=1 Tax=unclassified Breznakia TaxID=2623764 RepID=UPI00240749D4|nr:MULTISPECIES: hypothetical protein [unclassified Breznakia]MDF9825751.1 hypothetical protein [Breznakia sp. PM6-1]MDF9836558.1 hypothetical protein [Breznakia sp. PF5-3]MDF9838776.1 hypothetical protein [Breznakia sp. PFB2-8]MDF9860810.1 hypothetical protein [Breznakia sp. PH5-24]
MKSILSEINLINISSTKGWKGFDESNDWTKSNIETIVFNFFETYDYDSYEIYSSIDIELGQSIHWINDIENALIKKGYISIVERKDDDYINGFYKKISNINYYKNYSHVSKNDIKLLSILCMVDDYVEGSLFIHLINEQLIVYPHEDVGFGYIEIKK